MAKDSKGTEVFVGDEILVRCMVTDVTEDHVLTRTKEPPNRELWFQSAVVERAAQGALSASAISKEADAVESEAAVDAAEATTEAAHVVKVNAAVEYVKTHGYSQDAAEKIVAEAGYRTILRDRKDSEDAAAAAAAAKAAATPPATPAPANNAAELPKTSDAPADPAPAAADQAVDPAPAVATS